MSRTGFELVSKLPVVAQGVCDGGEEKGENTSPHEEHVGSCQHRRGRGRKGIQGKGGKMRRNCCLTGPSALSLNLGRRLRVFPKLGLICYVHPSQDNGKHLARTKDMHDPSATSTLLVHLGSKRSLSRRKTRKTRRNSP